MLLSIVIPLYNGEETINNTLSSIYNQKDFDLNNIEIIICDDKSTDNSINIIKENWINKLNIILTETENREIHCPGNTRIDGMKKATGKWITFLDCDDMFELNFFNLIFKNEIQDNIKYIITKVTEWDFINNKKLRDLSDAEIGAVLHGKIFNLSWLKQNNIQFKLNMNLLEDMYFNIMVNNQLIVDDYQYIIFDIYSYRWGKYSDSYSHKGYGNGNTSKYHREYMKGFMDATIETYFPIYFKVNLEKQEYIKLQIMCNLLHTYFYIQDCLYNKLLNNEDYVQLKQKYNEIINNINNSLNITKTDICNYIYSDVDRYIRLRNTTKSGKGHFIEINSFLDFVLS